MDSEVLQILADKTPEEKRLLAKLAMQEYRRQRQDINRLAEFVEEELQPKQRNLYELIETSTAKWIGYGGSRGGAKSGGLRRAMLMRRMNYPGSVGVIFRKTLDDLRDNHITPLFEEQPHLRQYYNVQNKELTIPITKDGIEYKSRILFVHEDNEKTFIETFQGKNFDDIFVDEATHLSEHQLVYMATSCRTTRTDMRSKFVLSMNPGGRSHSFIKRIFIDKKYIGNENPGQYQFLQAYGWDNVQWAKLALKEDGLTEEDFYKWEENKRFDYFVERTDYGRDLNQLPDNDRKAHLFGDWFVFAGQFFNMFSEENIVRGEYKPSVGSNIVGGLDYGQRTVLEVGDRDYEGNITTFLEVYSEQKTPGQRAEEIAEALIKNELWNLRIVYDTNMNINLRNYTGYDKTPIQIFKDVIREKFQLAGHSDKEPLFTVVSKASTSQYGYRAACNEAYKDYLYTKRHKIHESCVNLISTMPELVYDIKDGNGLDFDQNVGIDDPYDADKYMLMALWTPDAPEQQKTYESFEEFMDDTVFRQIHEKYAMPDRRKSF